MKYIINHRVHQVKIKYDPVDELYEAALIPDDGEPAEIKDLGYGETKKEAIKELEDRLFERGILKDIDNHYLPWESLDPETRRKILVYAKGLKSELLGEWSDDRSRYEKWRHRVLSWTSLNYGYTTPFTYVDFRRL